MLRHLVFAAGLVGFAAAAPVQATTQEFTGSLPSGAWYHIEIPDGWQPGDALVGFVSLDPPYVFLPENQSSARGSRDSMTTARNEANLEPNE